MTINIKSICKLSAVTLLGLFAMFGAMYLSIIFHELSHVNDLKDIDMKSEEICVVTLNSDKLGWYEFEYHKVDTNKVRQQMENTETKAYGISILFIVLFFASMSVLVLTIYLKD